MAEVVDLATRRLEAEPHMAGEARCLACKHIWPAVAPIGTAELECPSCALRRGVWVHPLEPAAGEVVWECNCGSQLYMLRLHGAWCVGCGTYAAWPP